MNLETIQKKKLALEEEFKKVDESRQKAQAVVQECAQTLIRLQGAYAQLAELEKELSDKPLEKVE